MRTWVHDPHSGGVKIPADVQARTRQRILAYAEEHFRGKYARLDIRFRGAFCYMDAYTEPLPFPNWPPPGSAESQEEFLERLRSKPTHLCRLRYFGDEDAWSFAFFTYSNEAYTPSVFDNGGWYGTPEEAFAISAGVYLAD